MVSGKQRYSGDITIVPSIRLSMLFKALKHPSREDMAEFIKAGEQAVYDKVSAMRNAMRMELSLDRCIRHVQQQLDLEVHRAQSMLKTPRQRSGSFLNEESKQPLLRSLQPSANLDDIHLTLPAPSRSSISRAPSPRSTTPSYTSSSSTPALATQSSTPASAASISSLSHQSFFEREGKIPASMGSDATSSRIPLDHAYEAPQAVRRAIDFDGAT